VRTAGEEGGREIGGKEETSFKGGGERRPGNTDHTVACVDQGYLLEGRGRRTKGEQRVLSQKLTPGGREVKGKDTVERGNCLWGRKKVMAKAGRG